ncbi:MAG: DnaD domain protein [Defluviitaleaceae bacterium]|nr:DnaD domain protein [Defluviitaleaceae bacterium]
MHLGYKASSLELPYVFIDNYLSGCAPVYPLIYIYSLRRLIGGDPVSVQELAERFRLLDTDVLNAWRHFEKVGIVQIKGVSPDISITFLPMPQQAHASKSSEPSPPVDMEKAIGFAIEQAVLEAGLLDSDLAKTVVLPSPNSNSFRPKDRPKYSTEELSIYHGESNEIKRLFSKGEEALGKLLDYNEMNLIFGLYDWLRLPSDVIEYLLSYCAEIDQTSPRYIETCAIDWANRGIDDLEKALTHVQGFDKDYRGILRQLGKTSFPSPAQQKLMDKWLIEMEMPMEVILDACDRTTLNAEKPSLTYVDKILQKWYKAGIKTMEEIKHDDEDFRKQNPLEQKSPRVKVSTKSQKPSKNRFVNFEQKDYDYAQIERLEREYLLQRVSTK